LTEIQSIAEYSQTGSPSREKLASLLVDLADRVSERGILATEFPTENALKKYLKEHPDADPKNHSVKKSLSHREHQKALGDKHKAEKELDKVLGEIYDRTGKSSLIALRKDHPLREKGMKIVKELTELDKKLKS
jgi:hypothetical protein